MGNYLSNYYYGTAAPVAAASTSEPKPDFQEAPATEVKSEAQVSVGPEAQVSVEQEVKPSEVQPEVKSSETKSEVKPSEVHPEVKSEEPRPEEQKLTIELPVAEATQPIEVRPAEPQARHKSYKRR